MKTLYLDIFSGISGDMFIGALIDLGVDAGQLELELRKLGLDGYHLHVARQQKAQIEGVKFDVHLEEHGEHTHGHEHEHEDHHHEHGEHGHSHSHGQGEHNHSHSHDGGEHHHDHEHRHGEHEHGEHGHSHEHHSHEHGHRHSHSHGEHGNEHSHEEGEHHHDHGHDHEHHHEHGRDFAQIKELILTSELSDWVKTKAVAIFHRIAVAEGKIHGMPPEEVHFHEVGAVDSIVDIVGGCIALELLGKPRVLSANAVEGTGWVRCAHGRFPIPAPATLAILGTRGIALSQCEEPQELITPTGAALLAELVEQFGPMQNLVAEKIGFGLGTRDNKTRPNVVRAILGRTEATASVHDWETDTVVVLETNLDDVSAELLGHFVGNGLKAGALDIFHTPIQMKKNRPGVLLSVLCTPQDADKFSELILRETSAFGVRRSVTERRKLRREFVKVATPYGEVTMKLGKLDGKVVQAAPEYEACQLLATEKDVPIKLVYAAALKSLNS